MKLGKIIRSIRVDPGSVIFVQEGIFGPRDLQEIAEGIKDYTGISDFALVVVKDVNQIRNLSETQMNKAGWFRAAKIASMLNSIRANKNNPKPEEEQESVD